MRTMNRKVSWVRFVFPLLITLMISGFCFACDPLPSWNEGASKKAIIDFVNNAVGKKGIGKYTIPVEDRLATFDLDGTIMCEKPASFQTIAALEKLLDDVRLNPSLGSVQPWKAAVETDRKYIRSHYDIVLGTAYKGFTQLAFSDSMHKFMTTDCHPVLHRLYCDLIYQPMLELIKYLTENEFEVWVCSGSMQGFIRSFSEEYLTIDPECVMGTSAALEYHDIDKDGTPELVRNGEILKPVNLKSGKVVNIYRWTDKQPILSFGNTRGDLEMLEFATSHPRHPKCLAGIIVHDDKKREYYYRYDDIEGAANANGWLKVSMKSDFKTVFKPKAE